MTAVLLSTLNNLVGAALLLIVLALLATFLLGLLAGAVRQLRAGECQCLTCGRTHHGTARQNVTWSLTHTCQELDHA